MTPPSAATACTQTTRWTIATRPRPKPGPCLAGTVLRRGVAVVNFERRHVRWRNVSDLLEGRPETLREERLPVARRPPPFDDAEAVVGRTGRVSDEPVGFALAIYPAQLCLHGVVLVDPGSRKLQDLTHGHSRILIPLGHREVDASPRV